MGLKIKDKDAHWPDGLVPFLIDDDHFPVGSPERAVIESAIEEVNAKTYVTLTPRISTDDSWIRFIDHPSDGRCGTFAGRRPGENQIFCDLEATLINGQRIFGKGTMIHEILHELGLHHEHLREDRNNFVEVRWDRIREEGCGQFQRKVAEEVFQDCGEAYDPDRHTLITEDVGPYDYASIMHYGRNAFRRPDATGNTLIPSNPQHVFIGQREGLSSGDIATLNTMYGQTAITIRKGENGSPDIIPRTAPIVDAASVLTTEAAMQRSDLGESLSRGKENLVYVRLQKTGELVDAAEVSLFWSHPNTLDRPEIWLAQGVDTTKTVTVEPDSPKVVGPFVFNELPPVGQYTLIAVAVSRKAPWPLEEGQPFRGGDERTNLATTRFVVNSSDDATIPQLSIGFSTDLSTASEGSILMDVSELPANVSTEIRLLKRVVAGATLTQIEAERETKNYRYFTTSGGNMVRVVGLTFGASGKTKVRIKIKFPDRHPSDLVEFHWNIRRGNISRLALREVES